MIRNYLVELGFREIEIERILKVKSISRFTEKTFLKNLRDVNGYLIDFGYSVEQIRKIIFKFSNVCSYSAGCFLSSNL